MPKHVDDRVARLHSGKKENRGYITAEMRHYAPYEHEPSDAEFILINYGVNDIMTKKQVVAFALGLLELTGELDSEYFIVSDKE